VDPAAFSDFLNRMDDLNFDVMFEAKAKELAVVRVMDYLRANGLLESLMAA
jgi:hypothetical protein